VLAQLVNDVRAGDSRVLVVKGEAGVGKTALLDQLADQATSRGVHVVRASGVESEMQLAYAGLHQLCRSLMHRVEGLPLPQSYALHTALGLRTGPPADRFLVGLAVLSLLSDVAGDRPLICIVDDHQWMDAASAQALEFVARRLAADPVGLAFAAREPGQGLASFPLLTLAGLPLGDARALLDSVLVGPIDPAVRDRIVAETRGNPLALLELPRGWTPAELAGGFASPDVPRLSSRIEQSFVRQIQVLPAETRRLLQLAAADSSGDPLLLWRAAEHLGISLQAGAPALEAGLLEFGTHVRFRHPLVRSAAYRSASMRTRQGLHRALAAVVDPTLEPDRRAWHLAQAALGPDEAVAAELEDSADRARRRGGIAASAAFLEQAAMLTPDPGHRAGRLLAAARSKSDAGALDAALEMLEAVQAGPMDTSQLAEVDLLRGQIALDRRHGSDAARLLLSAAERLQSVSVERAREAHLDALVAALWASHMGSPLVREAAEAAISAPPAQGSPRVLDVLLDALARRITEGYAAAAPEMTRALRLGLKLNAEPPSTDRWLWLAGGRILQMVAMDLWDDESWLALATGQVSFARGSGTIMHLTFALNYLARIQILAGNLGAADRLVEEDRLISEATGNTPIVDTEMLLAAWRGQEQRAMHLIETTAREADANRAERLVSLASYASSVLHNGLGRSAPAFEAASLALEREPVGYGSHIAPELAEAAARLGDIKTLSSTSDWLAERVQATPTEWALGIEMRVRAFLSEGDEADHCHLESIERLSHTRVRVHLARAHLLYGEWLRRENRRADARDQLRTAHDMFGEMGAEGFAERARRELVATGETVRKRRIDQADPILTPQESQVARLARDGLTNPEIGARLFISSRTVQYHLKKVFTKLGITSRTQLHLVLQEDDAVVQLT
jgi:DNA-binding CsgD family transcriptional regulator